MSSTMQHGASGSFCCKNSAVEANSLGSRPTDRNKRLSASRTEGRHRRRGRLAPPAVRQSVWTTFAPSRALPPTLRPGRLDCGPVLAVQESPHPPPSLSSMAKRKIDSPPVLSGSLAGRSCYALWDADGKVRQLDRLYPQLIAPDGRGSTTTITSQGATICRADSF
jgi:hypothetical protein